MAPKIILEQVKTWWLGVRLTVKNEKVRRRALNTLAGMCSSSPHACALISGFIKDHPNVTNEERLYAACILIDPKNLPLTRKTASVTDAIDFIASLKCAEGLRLLCNFLGEPATTHEEKIETAEALLKSHREQAYDILLKTLHSLPENITLKIAALMREHYDVIKKAHLCLSLFNEGLIVRSHSTGVALGLDASDPGSLPRMKEQITLLVALGNYEKAADAGPSALHPLLIALHHANTRYALWTISDVRERILSSIRGIIPILHDNDLNVLAQREDLFQTVTIPGDSPYEQVYKDGHGEVTRTDVVADYSELRELASEELHKRRYFEMTHSTCGRRFRFPRTQLGSKNACPSCDAVLELRILATARPSGHVHQLLDTIISKGASPTDWHVGHLPCLSLTHSRRLAGKYSYPRPIVFHASSNSVVVASGGKITFLSIMDGATKSTIDGYGPFAISRAGNLLAGSCKTEKGAIGNDIAIWRLPDGHLLHKLRGHTLEPTNLEFSPDSRHLVSAARDHTIRIWDVLQGQEIRKLSGEDSAISVSADGAILATGPASFPRNSRESAAIRIWYFPEGELRRIIRENSGYPDRLSNPVISPNGRILACRSFNSIVLFDLESLKPLVFPSPKLGDRACFVFTPDSRFIASSGEGGRVDVTELSEKGGKYSAHSHPFEVRGLRVSPDGRCLVSWSGESDHSLRLSRIPDLKQVAELNGHSEFIADASFVRDSRFLVTSSGDESIRFWDLRLTTMAMLEESQLLKADIEWVRQTSSNHDTKTPERAWIDYILERVRMKGMESGDH